MSDWTLEQVAAQAQRGGVNRQQAEWLVGRVRELEDAIRWHKQVADEDRTCCMDCLDGGKEPWSPEHDAQLWEHVNG